jgi:CMP-N,N'-diacetyllegionaminic acid synthase
VAEVLALIPARGGSKSIPRKNLLPLGGIPLIAHSIRQALSSQWITRTIVSTEDAEIATVARSFGAEVPFVRPAEYATDFATDLDVFEHALTELKRQGYEPDLVVQLRATSPMRKVEVIDRAVVEMLENPAADSLKSLSLSDKSPFKMWRIENGLLSPLLEIAGLPEAHSMPRQILPAVYTGNGYVDIIRPRTVLELKSMVGRTILPFVTDDECFDLDYPQQFADIEQAFVEQAGLETQARARR